MQTFKRIGLCGLTIALMVTIVGCPSLDPRTSNQGGGSLLTVGGKLSADNVGDLNADEWQILVDNLPSLAGLVGFEVPAGTDIPELSDEQAADLVNLLDQNNINTIAELTAAIDDGTLSVPDSLATLFS